MSSRRSSVEEARRLQRRRTVHEEQAEVQAETVEAGLPEGFRTSEKEREKRPLVVQKYRKYLPIILNIVHGAVWGVLARKGLMNLTTYSGSYLSGVIWANFTACLVMGLSIEGDGLWLFLLEHEVYSNKGSIPVYTGITTGFCGTLSSFSTVILDLFNRCANTVPGSDYHPPNAGYGVMNFLAVVLAEFGLSIMGFHMGKQFAQVIDHVTPSLTLKQHKILETASMVVAVCLVIITCVLLGTKPQGRWRSWTFSMFFAPFGAILRFYLSKYLNSKITQFPLGTFSANLLGTLLLAIFTLIGRGKLKSGGQISTHIMGCHVLTGLNDGFCGALTTVSTFVAELFGLKTLDSYRYGTASVMASFAIMVLVLGSYNWTIGLTEAVC
ncbi:uncharacterized protein LODBEIA_P58020 [Lodderomyces beijingensis]|uniref:Fluoride export protein 1 n=1 Tax=Lodderomyces beijingensis TaxID=1775926 RepID=A0ABP0ZTW2_9ASCO